jgi:hypothetical protein
VENWLEELTARVAVQSCLRSIEIVLMDSLHHSPAAGDPHDVTRRTFLRSITTGVTGVLALDLGRPAAVAARLPLRLQPSALTGGCARVEGPAIIPGAIWYEAHRENDGLAFRFEPGALADVRFLTADIFADSPELPVFQLRLREGEEGPPFTLVYAVLPYAQARMRMQAVAINQNRWQFLREGAWLKPMAGGSRVDLSKVDRMDVIVLRKGERPVRWCQTPITAMQDEPPRLAEPRLPKGALLDELGQSTTRNWPGKTRSLDELKTRLNAQLAAASAHKWPDRFSQWGGLAARLEKSDKPGGFFRTHHDGTRWWLLDPGGHPFWSAGLVSVRVDTAASYDGLESALAWMPPKDGEFKEIYDVRSDGRGSINYLAANFIRTFGAGWYDKWTAIALGELRRLGFNTIANWSDWEIARAARFPYVRPLAWGARAAPFIYRDFPDVFDPHWDVDATRFGEQLSGTRDDPAFIGYFLMNEPTWGFARETPASGMLFNTPRCATRRALGDELARKYGDDRGLSNVWGFETTLAAVREGEWTRRLTPPAERDLAEFSAVMVEKFFGALSASCRRVDANHLNLGIRYHTIPPQWAVSGMRSFDVFSMNCYDARVRSGEMEKIAATLKMPIMVGEWHFGALDVGLPASGIGHVRTQDDRGRAYRVYLEDAAAKPWCVGVHYFILYDQSALGRFDGECYNIGFLDVCNRPYEPLCNAARASHERMYDVATGKVQPYGDAPEYLPKLFV